MNDDKSQIERIYMKDSKSWDVEEVDNILEYSSWLRTLRTCGCGS